MAATKRETPPAKRTRPVPWSMGVAGAIAVAVWLWSLLPPPQIGTDRDVFTAVDALFTAVTAKDELRLTECEKRLRTYRERGKLPTDAADALDAVIRRARAGAWQSAAERLYDFMKGQRWDGAAGESLETKNNKKKSKAA